MAHSHSTSIRTAAQNYLAHAPLSLALREVNRGWVMSELEKLTGQSLQYPLLDVGCGDGFWWSLHSGIEGIYGIDISKREIDLALKNGVHAKLHDISSARPPFDIDFKTVIGNCSLEHVRDIVSALKNIHAGMAPGANLVLFVPAPQWAYHGFLQKFLMAYLPRIGMALSGAMNGFFQHWHLYEVNVWESLLNEAGFEMVITKGLGSKRAEFLFRLFLPCGFLSFIFKKMTGVYPNLIFGFLPKFFRTPALLLMEWALQNPITESSDPAAYEFLLVAKKGK